MVLVAALQTRLTALRSRDMQLWQQLEGPGSRAWGHLLLWWQEQLVLACRKPPWALPGRAQGLR